MVKEDMGRPMRPRGTLDKGAVQSGGLDKGAVQAPAPQMIPVGQAMETDTAIPSSLAIPIYIAGVPPGVSIGIFDKREQGEEADPIVLEETPGPEHDFITTVDKSYNNTPIRLVVRSAGFLPQTIDTEITTLGLFRSVEMRPDNAYSGDGNEFAGRWNTSAEFEAAQQRLLRAYADRVSEIEQARFEAQLDELRAELTSQSQEQDRALRRQIEDLEAQLAAASAEPRPTEKTIGQRLKTLGFYATHLVGTKIAADELRSGHEFNIDFATVSVFLVDREGLTPERALFQKAIPSER